jgi:hypothetical protein
MPVLPHDTADLYLAPLLLVLDERLEELSRLELDELHVHVGLVSDQPDWTREIREAALLQAIRHTIDCHDWDLSWHARGLLASHGRHRVVLGVPKTFSEYLDGAHQHRTGAPNAG